MALPRALSTGYLSAHAQDLRHAQRVDEHVGELLLHCLERLAGEALGLLLGKPLKFLLKLGGFQGQRLGAHRDIDIFRGHPAPAHPHAAHPAHQAQIIRKGRQLGVDYALTSSCYDPGHAASPAANASERGRRTSSPGPGPSSHVPNF